MDLASLIAKWIREKSTIRDHFMVDNAVKIASDLGWVSGKPKPPWDESWITFKCENSSGYRRSAKCDVLLEIQDDCVVDGRTTIAAADPELFKKIESILRRKHDRTGEFNIITFRNDCKVKLRDCGCVKAFCGC
jgi:hypothetical protein